MRRRDLIRHLEGTRCILLRQGKKHSVYFNEAKKKVSTVPRHKDINDLLVRKICRDLEIPNP